MPCITRGEEKMAPISNWRSVATTGASRQGEKKFSGPLNFRSAVSTQPLFWREASVWKSQSASPLFRSRAWRVPLSTPIKTTSPATAGEEKHVGFVLHLQQAFARGRVDDVIKARVRGGEDDLALHDRGLERKISN